MLKKKFRIIKNELSEEGAKAYHPLWYKIEERYTLFFFIHWWGTPSFAPPHLHETYEKAYQYLKEQRKNAIII